MERKTLQFIRLIVPGLILVFESLPLFNAFGESFEINKGLLSYSFLILIAVAIGAFYRISNIRYFITNYSHKKIDLNITESLAKIYPKELTQEQHNFLKEKRRLKNIFYYIIDNDPSLTAKSQNVYLNGALWTSTADAFIISLFCSIVCLIVGAGYLKSSHIVLWSLILAGIGIISFLLHILTVFQHINISNDQLEYIETNKRNQVETKIDEVLQQMPNVNN